MTVWRAVVMLLELALAGCTTASRTTDTGRFVEVEQLIVAGLPDQRLTIWLPPGYDVDKQRRFPVLYMHDGHNLFDLAKSNFNKVWAADRAMLAAMERGVEPHIIVGIWAPGRDRYRQYLPRTAYDRATGNVRAAMDAMTDGDVVSDRYLAWIADELKPMIDRDYRTRTGRDDTAIAGSSMGGLMSCYAFVERPDRFGRAACVSSHWPAANPAVVGDFSADLLAVWMDSLVARLGKPDGRRLWMDHGTATLDRYYAAYQRPIDAAVERAGWRKGTDFESRVYAGAEHEENAWAARLPDIFVWLLGP